MRDGQDQLVSGSTLAAGIVVVPGGGASNITLQDEPLGLGKLLTFSSTGITPSADYQVVVSAKEEVITNVDDPFLKNVNIPESTAQKLRLTYRINIVPKASQTSTPVPYTDSVIAGNLVNYIDVTPQSGGNGSEISRTVVSASAAIDGRSLEITIRNNPSSSNPSYSGSPVGNLIPTGATQQQEYSNGKFVDSQGQTYWLNAIFNDVVANQVILRISKEVTQTDPLIIVGKPYRLQKRDVYVTDDISGTPLGQLFWPLANVTWSSGNGFVHSSKVEDLRNSVEDLNNSQDKTTVKFDLRLLGGGVVAAEPATAATGTAIVIDNTFVAGDALVVNGVSFVYNVDWAAGIDVTATAAAIVAAISASHNPLVDGVITASALAGTITLTAVVPGTSGNALTLTKVDTGASNFTLSATTLTGGIDGTAGELTWDADFKIANPHGVVQSITASNLVLREGGAAAYNMDLANGGTISKGNLAVTSSTTGTSITLTGSPDLSKISVGNTLVVGQTSTSITAIDDVTKVLTVSPSLGVSGAGTVYLDTYAQGTLPTDPDSFILAIKIGSVIQVTARGDLEPGESTSSDIPIQLLEYIGATSESDSDPNYSSTDVVNQGSSLTAAIGTLDEHLGEVERRLNQLKLSKHPAVLSKAIVAATDVALLDGSILSQELNTFILSFTGAVINFTTGNILASDDSTALGINFTPFSVPVSQYFWYSVGIIASTVDANNKVTAQVQVTPATSANAVQASAPLPNLITSKNLGAVQVYNNAGSIEVVAVRRLGAGSGGGGAPGIIKVELYDPISTTLPTGISPTIDGTTLLENDLVFFNNLTVNNTRVYKATNVSTSVVWTVQRVFANSSETPFSGDSIRVVKGTLFAGQIVYLDAAGNYLVNDTARYFSGNKGTNYWELGSLKTATLADNTTLGTVFSVLAANSENWIINYSVVRGAANRETGQIYITSNGTIASSTTNNSYFGDTGTTFDAVISGPNLILKYSTTNTGAAATMKFFVSRWSDSAGGVGGIPSYPPGGSSTVAAGAIGDVQYKGNDGNLAGDTKFKVDVTNSSLNLDGLLLSTLQGPTTLLDNQVAQTLTLIPYSYKWIVVEYSLLRDGHTQLGRLLIVNNNTTAIISDDFVQTGSLGVSFTVDIVATDVRLKYTTTSTSFNASFKYILRRWQ